MANGFVRHPLKHLLGRVTYRDQHRFKPDGDTIHLRDPILLQDGRGIRPDAEGRLEIWVPGLTRPRVITVKGRPARPYVPIRLQGLDATEQHYNATSFSLKLPSGEINFPIDPAVAHDKRSQPQWKPATDYLLNRLEGKWVLVELDREVLDKYQRVLGYVFLSDSRGARGPFVSLEMLRRGLAFPFLFESSGDRIPTFLSAAKKARQAGRGVWRNFVDHPPIPFGQTFPAPPTYTSPEPAAQGAAPVNLPVVFRRVIDARQLKGLTLNLALQKYDAMNFDTGDVFPGDQYHRVPIDSRIWAPHNFV